MAIVRVLSRAAVACLLTLHVISARAADTVLVGSVDAASANLWPLYIGQKLGYFDAAGLKLDLNLPGQDGRPVAVRLERVAARLGEPEPPPIDTTNPVEPLRNLHKDVEQTFFAARALVSRVRG